MVADNVKNCASSLLHKLVTQTNRPTNKSMNCTLTPTRSFQTLYRQKATGKQRHVVLKNNQIQQHLLHATAQNISQERARYLLSTEGFTEGQQVVTDTFGGGVKNLKQHNSFLKVLLYQLCIIYQVPALFYRDINLKRKQQNCFKGYESAIISAIIYINQLFSPCQSQTKIICSIHSFVVSMQKKCTQTL